MGSCFSPHIVNYENVDGKVVLFWKDARSGQLSIPIPCQRCIGCKLARARDWCVRCMLEASLYERNCFVTLTYNEKHRPVDGSLDYRDFQLFFKKLRNEYGKGIKFFMCGEYGDVYGRPHFHSILFNFDFPDKEFLERRGASNLYRSRALENLWSKGFTSVGSVTAQSVSYVSRYCLKKVYGGQANSRYLDLRTGVLKEPEFVRMSRGGRNGRGIAAAWFERFSSDVYPSDGVVVDGRVNPVPRYFDKALERVDPQAYDFLKEVRLLKPHDSYENSFERLKVKEFCTLERVKLLKRSLGD